MTYMAFKVLCFLMLYKDFFIIKIPVTIPAPRLQLLLLLTAHSGGTSDLHRKETAELFSPEPQRPHQPLHGGERGRHKMAEIGRAHV